MDVELGISNNPNLGIDSTINHIFIYILGFAHKGSPKNKKSIFTEHRFPSHGRCSIKKTQKNRRLNKPMNWDSPANFADQPSMFQRGWFFRCHRTTALDPIFFGFASLVKTGKERHIFLVGG